ncbi:zinc-binding dehydrogenase [Amycolatopsis acidiphila]|nr:zinc-binding dehydrogenase [Amycolatopsis acidiphila]UIJ63884.1 zinc-binding dehydrogenase [Amycolatopsis acidiphila]
MRAAMLRAPGPPEQFEVTEVEIPRFGRDEVLVQVRACGVSSRDVVERNGTYRRDVTFPLVIGLEISGTVVECGQDVPDLRPGDHVCSKAFSSCGQCRLCRTGRETTCSRRRPVRGGYAEYVVLPWDALVRVPSGLPFEETCGLGPAGGVALNAVRDVARVTVGETVLITGATGGVGWMALQIARLSGARVIAATRDPDRRSSLLEAGADEVIVIDGPDFSPQVRTLTDGEGVDVVVDTVGSPVFGSCFNSLAVHGRYALVGQLLGEEISINPARIFFKRASLLGVGSVSRAQLADVVDLAARGQIRPRIACTLPLDDVVRAHHLVERSALFGRVVLAPSPSASTE